MATALTVSVRIDGARDTLAAFRALPKDASTSLRRRTLEVSELLATRIATAARNEGRQAALIAGTVKARRDRVPTIQAGGARRVGRNRAPAYGVLFGSEFGMNARSGWYAAAKYDDSFGSQYKPHRGRSSYWFFRTVDDNMDEVAAAWRKVADDIERSFAGGA